MTYNDLIVNHLKNFSCNAEKKRWLERMIKIFKNIEFPDVVDKSILCILSNEFHKIKRR